MPDQWLWADGGESTRAPANTMQAIWAAIGAGCDGVSLTVQATSDGVVVCAPEAAGLTSREVRALDAGAAFRSTNLDERNRISGEPGKDTPWRQHDQQRDGLYHPELQEVLLHVGRRTSFLITIRPDGKASEETVRTLTDRVLAILTRHAILGRTVLAGDARVVRAVGNGHARVCLDPGSGATLTQARTQAAQLQVPLVLAIIATAAEVSEAAAAGPSVIVRPTSKYRAIDPEVYRAAAGQPWVAGYLVPAVHEMHALMHPRGLVLTEEFAGPEVDARLWTLGHSRNNNDTAVTIDGGLRIKVDGPEYSGGAALSNFSIYGDFDARMAFEVENPQQGTTFELAAVHVDAGYRPVNLTFDVHGAPPYASSERDENDGFRIGWNNGPALTRWVENEAQSSNLYNCYGRDVGYARTDSRSGRLRLTRRGDVFNAYYTDRYNTAWVLSGSVAVPALAPAVFLRLGAKHWPKRGNEPPSNVFRFSGFELYQWD